MLGPRIAALLVAAITLGLGIGGAMSYVVTPTPTPTIAPAPQVVTYTITPGPQWQFTPYISAVHMGLVEFRFVNLDPSVHAFMLVGTGWLVVLMPSSVQTTFGTLHHSGVYDWMNIIPVGGIGQDQLIGVLAVS